VKFEAEWSDPTRVTNLQPTVIDAFGLVIAETYVLGLRDHHWGGRTWFLSTGGASIEIVKVSVPLFTDNNAAICNEK